MEVEEIRTALDLALRFAAQAERVLTNNVEVSKPGFEYLIAGKETGQLRRTSMDLTRQLATMRKPS